MKVRMLVLTRKPSEAIRIGEGSLVKIEGAGDGEVKIRLESAEAVDTSQSGNELECSLADFLQSLKGCE